MQDKINFLNKKIKTLEIQINNDKSRSNSFINNINQEEVSNDFKKLHCNLTQQNLNKINIRNVKNIYNRNNLSINNKINIIDQNRILFNKNNNPKKANAKKLLLRNISSSNIDFNNKKNIICNYNNRNRSINDNISNYIYKINESDLNNNISKDNNNSIQKNNNNSSYINGNTNSKLKLKLPVNITNNNFNMNKNNVMINLSTNIVDNDLNLEKLKVQQKLKEYHKLIDLKINELMNKRSNNLNNKRKKTKSNSKKSPKNNYEIYKKVSICCLNSDCNRKYKKKYNNKSNTNYKVMNNEHFKKMHDNNVIMPKKINPNDYNKKIINSNSQNNIKSKRCYNQKLNIVSKDIDEKSKFNIDNKEHEKNYKIHEQITSKGNEEEKSEDSK